MSATGDWTKNVPNEEWPAIKKVYDLYGAGDKTAVVQFNYGHNYNIESREAMYAWMARWLQGESSRREQRTHSEGNEKPDPRLQATTPRNGSRQQLAFRPSRLAGGQDPIDRSQPATNLPDERRTWDGKQSVA